MGQENYGLMGIWFERELSVISDRQASRLRPLFKPDGITSTHTRELFLVSTSRRPVRSQLAGTKNQPKSMREARDRSRV
jgi:hypothetical protein